MIPYYSTYILIIFCNYISKTATPDSKKQRSLFCAFSFIIITALLSLRHQTMGIDLWGGNSKEHIGYLGAFEHLNRYSWAQLLSLKSYLNYEYGYIIFNKLVGGIYNNKQFFLCICAIISIAPIMIYINKKSTQTLLSVFIFLGLPVFLLLFSGLRQALAISITVYSVKYIEDKKIVKFILTVLFATLFHYSSIIFLISYPLYYLRLSKVKKLLSVIFIPIIYILKAPLFLVLSKLFSNSAKITETGAVTLFIVFFLIYVFLIFFNKEQDEHINGIINLFYMACICQAFGGVYQLAMRVGYYFMIYATIAIPNTINSMNDKKSSKLLNILIFAAFVGFGIYSLRNSTWAMTYPYKFYWKK